jgi:integrase
VFAVAKPMWGYGLDQQAMADAATVAKRMGLTSKSRERNRRPTLPELDALLKRFGEARRRRPDSSPMQAIVAVAIFSTRRLDEITRPHVANAIFPYGGDAISAAFTRACKLLDINDLHFHDLRHEGGQAGDKYAGWHWLETIAPIATAASPL